MSLKTLMLAATLVLVASQADAEDFAFPVHAQSVLFLGDSITNDGHYIALVESQLRLSRNDQIPELINLGLPSETCSGLSEPEHPFPRPDVHERIDRALEKIKPDVVVACYGMNDGIYYPLSEDRFAAYRRGISTLIEKVHAAGAKLVLMTPPAFDPLPLRNKGQLRKIGADEYSWKTIYEDYDDVMKAYAAFVTEQRDRVEMIVDLHSAVTNYTRAKRKTDPGFTMSPDGVHLNHEGHAVLADAILDAWGFESVQQPDAELLSLVSQRQKTLHDAWLSEVGHLRPGVKKGLPLAEAQEAARELDKRIQARIDSQIDPAVRAK